MSVDAQRFMDLTTYLHMAWSAPLQIGLALYFLYALVGPSAFAGLGVMVLMGPLNALVARKTRDFQKAIMELKDKRIKLLNELLQGIKVLKLYAWERPFAGFVSDVRDKEVKVLRSAAYYNAVANFSWSAAPFLVSLITFITYTASGHHLTAQIAFVSLSLFNLLDFPLVSVKERCCSRG